MKLKVTKDLCEIKENEIWNVGDYNVHTVQVELSPEFNGLVNKVRYFVEDNSYDMLITDNVAQVPYEATVMEGTIKIGVYGYDADTDILVQSTSPVNKYITSGTYTGDPDNTQPLTPTDKEQMESAIQKNTNDITDLKANKQDKLISGVNIKTINNESILSGGNLTLVAEETDPIFTNSPAYSITDNDITYWNNKANMSDIPDVSNFITKDVDDLTYYTKSTDMQNTIDSAVNTEKVARENADVNLQNQIDAITVSSDVVDVVSTYQDLVDYDTSHIKANDIIKVMQDSTHDNAISYYRWVIVNHVGSWVYVGSEGPYYTKSETDTLLNAKQNTISPTNKLQSDLVDDTNQNNLFVTSTEKTTWNNKLDQSDLNDYVKNTDYASSSKGGVIKTGSGTNVDNNGIIYADNQTYPDYSSSSNNNFISKGTLENVITGKNLETANNKVTNISSSSTDVQYPSAKCVYDNDVIIKDDVNTKYDYLFSLTNLFGKITGTGTSVTLNDTSDTIMKLNLDTTTSSQNTPTGKNLYHMSSATPNSSTSYTINSNNSIRVYNTSSSWRSAYTELTVPAGNYAFSFQNIVTSGAKQVIIQKVIGGTATDFKTMTITNETTFTLDSETLLRFVFFSTTGTNEAGDVTYSNIQLEVGSSVTSFEPYTGGQPAPSPSYPQEIHTVSGDNTIIVSNANLWNEQWELGKIEVSNTSPNFGQKVVSTTQIRAKNYIEVKPSTTYYCYRGGSTGSIILVLYDENFNGITTWNSYGYKNVTNTTFTTANNAKYALWYATAEYGTTYNNNITIAQSSEAISYIKYKKQEYPINLGVENIITTYKTSGSGFINWNYDNSKIKKQMTYSFIADFSTTNATIYMRPTDNGTLITLGVIPTITSGTVSSITFTLTDEQLNSIKSTTGGFIQVYRTGVEMTSTSLSNVQLEEGTKVNSYSPYNQTPIELCKIGTYEDILFKNTINSEYYDSSLELNKWYKLNRISKLILNGTENWAVHGTIASWFYWDGLTDGFTDNTISGYTLSNYFTQKAYSTVTSLKNGEFAYGQVAGETRKRFVIKDTDYTTVADFKTWLSTHNTIVYYPLATPTYTLLNDTIQTQLNNMQYALAYDTQTNISQTNTDLPFIINAETFAKIGG